MGGGPENDTADSNTVSAVEDQPSKDNEKRQRLFELSHFSCCFAHETSVKVVAVAIFCTNFPCLSLELSVDNEDELPPTLEADGVAKVNADQNECIFDTGVRR